MSLRIFSLLVLVCSGMQVSMAHAFQLEMSVADIVSPAFSAKIIRVVLSGNGEADLHVAEFSMAEKKWGKVHLHCKEFNLSAYRIYCREGVLAMAPDLPITLSYEFASKRLDLKLLAQGGEQWLVKADFLATPWHVSADLRKAQAFRVAALIPAGLPLPGKGWVNGKLEIQGDKSGMAVISADMQLHDISFSDSSGLHAGEKVSGNLTMVATQSEKIWDSQISLKWTSGELFWQPLYLRGGHEVAARAKWDGAQLTLSETRLALDGVGVVEVDGVWDAEARQLTQAWARGNNLELTRLYSEYAKPFLGSGVMADLGVSGKADLSWKYGVGSTREVNIGLRDVALVDEKNRFSLQGVFASIPWNAEQAESVLLSFKSGAVWGIPLGATDLKMKVRGLDFEMPQASIPVLDGKLSVNDFHLFRKQDEWSWSFSGALAPISMPPLSLALGWPEMKGSLSGMIPHVSYQSKSLTVNGALLFRIFDGSVVVSSLNLFDPFGLAPRLYGNLDMRELDLGALTQAFSFGNVQGRIDVKVNELELVNWLPVHFDARVSSSPGSYRKRISQKAVQNISSLGGAGAAAAVQRSMLSVFDTFGYDRIVLSCVLKNGVCLMDGAESAEKGYFIVKGGGIPAINVMGYNHEVDWNELLSRLKRVIKGNTKAVVK